MSLRLASWFPQPSKGPNSRPNKAGTPRPFSAAVIACAAAAGAATVAGIAAATRRQATQEEETTSKSKHPFVQNAIDLFFNNNIQSRIPMWASLSLAENSASFIESKTGVAFPTVLGESKELLGVGLRKKNILGFKNIGVYAFGVYADNDEVKRLASEKYGNLSAADIKGKRVNDDLMEADIQMTVRLQIVYGKLSIRSVRSAFEESVGSRLQKFGGSENKELLQSFTSQFKDEYKIPKGSVIDLSREKGYVLRTTIDGKEIGSIQSKLLCRSIFDLYIGEDPFDRKAKEEVELKLASFVQN